MHVEYHSQCQRPDVDRLYAEGLQRHVVQRVFVGCRVFHSIEQKTGREGDFVAKIGINVPELARTERVEAIESACLGRRFEFALPDDIEHIADEGQTFIVGARQNIDEHVCRKIRLHYALI